MNPTISLCITCYNGDYHLLPSLLAEFAKQTVAPDEIIISSSGMKSHELIKVNSLPIADTKVPIIHNNSEERIMQSMARNSGAKRSTKDVVIFFDIDDIPHPQKIEVTRYLFSGDHLYAFIHGFTHDGDETPGTDFGSSEEESKKAHDSFERVERLEDIPFCRVIAKHPLNTNIITEEGVGNIHHSHIAVRREIFDQVQFNESTDFYRREDGKFCQDIVDTTLPFIYSKLKLVYYH